MANTKFLEVFKDFNYGEELKVWNVGREIIAIDSILHVYVVQGDEEAICIEYKTKHGKSDIYETFDNKTQCLSRFYEIKRLLCEED